MAKNSNPDIARAGRNMSDIGDSRCCPFSKNQDIILKIDDIGNDGEGIGHYKGYAVFVNNALPGDEVIARIMKIKKSYAYARLMDIVNPSPDRIQPVCDIAAKCGGCQLQHMSYDAQLEYKSRKVRNCLVRIGGYDGAYLAGIEEQIIGMENPYNYRNKAQFPVQQSADGQIVSGFYAGRTHNIIATEECCIQMPESNHICSIVREWMNEYGIPSYDETTHSGIVRHILTRIGKATGEIMVCLVVTSKRVPFTEVLVERLRKVEGMTCICLNINSDRTNRILGSKLISLYGPAYIEDCIGAIRYRISPLSFYQVNPEQTIKLYNTALEYAGLTGNETVWDLYCGIGTISLFLAHKAKYVLGIEIVPEAIEDAKVNASINGIENAVFLAGAAEDVAARIVEDDAYSSLKKPDVVVVDPPRKGCDSRLIQTIVKVSPERIVYVSCDPATLARDVKVLKENGYGIRKYRACDMFGMTGHVETVVLLSHKKPDSHINVKVEFGEGEGKVPLKAISERAEAYKPKERVTYKMIKEYIEAKYGFKVHTAYIAEVKRDLGLPMYDAPNAVEELKQPRKHPTAEKVEAIKDALKHFEVI